MTARVVVIGAGLSGLTAARTLTEHGIDVVVIDKGKSPGGRVATRRIGEATLDHGAQFFTVREPRFKEIVEEWLRHDVVREWCTGFDDNDGHPRYRGVHGMTDIAKYLAHGLSVRYDSLAFSVQRGTSTKWSVLLDTGENIPADAVIATCPTPQSYSLTITTDLDIPEELISLDYDRTICLLAVVDQPLDLGPHGARQQPCPSVSFAADNHIKGVSTVPALTMHADAEWSLAHWDSSTEELTSLLRELAAPLLGQARILESNVKKWRFATPRTIWPERCLALDGIVFAGDAFGGPRVEGAVLSGLAAAQAVSESLS